MHNVDNAEATIALRSLSAEMAKRTPEVNINPALPARVAALLLRLTGEEADEVKANSVDSGLDLHFTYEKDYLSQPSRSFFRLERRHAGVVLEDTGLHVQARIERVNDLWLDPTFVPPPGFVEEVQNFLPRIDIDSLNSHSSWTREDHLFEKSRGAFARCTPKLLADMIGRKLQTFHSSSRESRYWNAIHVYEYLLLAGEAGSEAARVLRLSEGDTTGDNEAYARNQLIGLEIHRQGFLNQVCGIIEARLEYILTDLCEIISKATVEETEALIARYGSSASKAQRDLLSVLAHGDIPFSDTVWSWIIDKAFSGEPDVEGLSFLALARLDESRFGHELLARDWTWSPSKELWVNHYGSCGLMAATAGLPFEQVAPHIAPWRLVEAARQRGENSTEIAFAAKILDFILTAECMEAPDPGAILCADCTAYEAGMLSLSVTTGESEKNMEDPFTDLKASMDAEARVKALHRAAETAANRIREAQSAGASLYLMELSAEDMVAIFRIAPEFINKWLEGEKELTADFKRRVMLAETAYLSICEALLRHHSERGVTLWRSLKEVLHTRFTGSAEIDEMIHIVFRSPETPAIEELREELIDLPRCNSDKNLLDIVIAATLYGKAGWVRDVIKRDQLSPFAWRRKRGAVLSGFQSNNTLPVEGAWPEGGFIMGHDELLRRAARHRYREACAHHWWKQYLNTTDIAEAYAAWVLFLGAADRRVWVWMAADAEAVDDSTELFRLKMIFVELNHSALKRAIEKNEEKLDQEFLGRKIVKGVDPWIK